MTLSLIAGIGSNNELGRDNKLLWNLPADMKHFRDTTSGHPVIMGRKTFESIGRSLPNRRNIIITGDPSYTRDGIEVVHSLDEAIALFKDTDDEVFVIGGAEIYKLAISIADKLYITHIAKAFEADTFFPNIDSSQWEETSRETHEPDEKNNYAYALTTYGRKDR
jgi:dihydrofolate reductase